LLDEWDDIDIVRNRGVEIGSAALVTLVGGGWITPNNLTVYGRLSPATAVWVPE